MKFSPSHLYGLEDFLLNHTLMDICIDTYTGHPLSYEFDPFRSPNHLSDEVNYLNNHRLLVNFLQ